MLMLNSLYHCAPPIFFSLDLRNHHSFSTAYNRFLLYFSDYHSVLSHFLILHPVIPALCVGIADTFVFHCAYRPVLYAPIRILFFDCA